MRKAVVVPRSLEVESQRESSLRDGSLDLVLEAQHLRTKFYDKSYPKGRVRLTGSDEFSESYIALFATKL